MPTSTTTTQTAYPGGELTLTYDSKARITSATLFVPKGCTGTIAVTTLGVTQVLNYVVPLDASVLPSPVGSVAETLNGLVGARWTQPIAPAWDPAADGNGFAFGMSQTG